MKNKRNSGFSLIEIMIVVAIIGILSSIAIPSYQDFTVRSRVIEGLHIATSAKSAIAEGAPTDKTLLVVANSWNNKSNYNGTTPTSKFVDLVTINSTSGTILVDYNASAIGLQTGFDQLTLTPFVYSPSGLLTLPAAFTAGEQGSLEWACISSTDTTASNRALTGNFPSNPLPAKFAPSECR